LGMRTAREFPLLKIRVNMWFPPSRLKYIQDIQKWPRVPERLHRCAVVRFKQWIFRSDVAALNQQPNRRGQAMILKLLKEFCENYNLNDDKFNNHDSFCANTWNCRVCFIQSKARS
jgi:hypothetical protein